MKKKVTPLLTQMRPAYFSVDCGCPKKSTAV